MKRITLTKDNCFELLKECLANMQKQLKERYLMSDKIKIDCSIETNKVAVGDERPLIEYTPQAYLRMKALVDHFTSEVGWYGLVDRVAPNHYIVYDVRVCKQYVSGVKVDTDDDDMIDFFSGLSDEEAKHMHFQAHSHVSMATEPSGVDTQNQFDVIHSMGEKGFYIFQIWNKQGNINTFLWDLDNNVKYDKHDVDLCIQDDMGSLAAFIESIADLVCEKKFDWTQKGQYGGYKGTEKYTETAKTATAKKNETSRDPQNEEEKWEKREDNTNPNNRFGSGFGGYDQGYIYQ